MRRYFGIRKLSQCYSAKCICFSAAEKICDNWHWRIYKLTAAFRHPTDKLIHEMHKTVCRWRIEWRKLLQSRSIFYKFIQNYFHSYSSVRLFQIGCSSMFIKNKLIKNDKYKISRSHDHYSIIILNNCTNISLYKNVDKYLQFYFSVLIIRVST